MFSRHECGGIIYFTSPVLDSFSVPHLFAARYGGVSKGCFGSLNVSPARRDENGNTDSSENIAENYRRALEILNVSPKNACTTKQVHSVIVKTAQGCDAGSGILSGKRVANDCDAVLLRSGTPDLYAACVKTADCVPILLANVKTGDVCAVHAGWRGTVGGIAMRAAKAFECDMTDIAAAIGPCIGRCCYEVGDEVYLAVKQLFASVGIEDKTDAMFTNEVVCSISNKKYADLALINKTLLISCGVPENNIDISQLCTCCTLENKQPLFFSHRGMKGHSGTFVSAIRAFGR